MSRRSDSSLAALLLSQRLVDTDASPLKASQYWAVLDAVADPASLLGLDAGDVARQTGVDTELAEQIARLLDAAAPFAFELEQAEQSGLRVVSSIDDEYPRVLSDRLGRAAPPLLYVAGDTGLLVGDLLGIVGSRDVAPAGVEVARGAAVEAARHDHGIVSGGAKGVDRLAMQAALEAGAPVIGMLADSLLRTTRDAEVRRGITDGQVCLCTAYKPSAGFSVANAMGRNKLIYGLSRATLVVASDLDRGGTWSGAIEALRNDIAPVLVWRGDGEGSGNERLVEQGASACTDVDQLFPLPSATQARVVDNQLALDV